jgi:hypothetical protein
MHRSNLLGLHILLQVVFVQMLQRPDLTWMLGKIHTYRADNPRMSQRGVPRKSGDCTESSLELDEAALQRRPPESTLRPERRTQEAPNKCPKI